MKALLAALAITLAALPAAAGDIIDMTVCIIEVQ